MGKPLFTGTVSAVSKQNLYKGKSGEDLASKALEENGYKIIRRNYRVRLAEIDIIARDKDTYCFVEVKSRLSDRFGLPAEAVSVPKQNKISMAAVTFLKQNNLLDKKARFDVVTVTFDKDNPRVELIKNAFELDERYSY